MSAVRLSLRRASVPGVSALLSLTLLAAGLAATSARYSIAEVTSIGGRAAYPVFLTDSGQIAGSADAGLPDQNGVPHHEVYYRSASGDIHTYSFGTGTESYGLGVNSASLLVGDVYPSGVGGRAFVVDASTTNPPTDLHSLLGAQEESHALAVNDAGEVVGSFDGHAYVWSATGGTIDLGPGEALAINNAGEVVGYANSFDGNQALVSTPFYFKDTNGNRAVDPGELVPLGTLGGGLNNRAIAINDQGVIVGESQELAAGGNGNVHGVKWSVHTEGAAPTDLGTLPNTSSQAQSITQATGINNQGQIVGVSNFQPFLWENGVMKRLSDLIPANSRWLLYFASKINNSGKIIGTGQIVSASTAQRGFLLTPTGGSTPPPAAVQLASLKVSPSKARAGKQVTATLALTGKTTAAQQIPLTLKFNGQAVTLPAPLFVTLKAKKSSGTLKFKIPAGLPVGTYEVSATLGVTKTAALTITP